MAKGKWTRCVWKNGTARSGASGPFSAKYVRSAFRGFCPECGQPVALALSLRLASPDGPFGLVRCWAVHTEGPGEVAASGRNWVVVETKDRASLVAMRGHTCGR